MKLVFFLKILFLLIIYCNSSYAVNQCYRTYLYSEGVRNTPSRISEELFKELLLKQKQKWVALEKPVTLETSQGKFYLNYVIGKSTSIVMLDSEKKILVKFYNRQQEMAKNEFLQTEYLHFNKEIIPKVFGIDEVFMQKSAFLNEGTYIIIIKDYFEGLTSDNLYAYYGRDYFEMPLYKDIWDVNRRISSQFYNPLQFRDWIQKNHQELSQEEINLYQRDGVIVPNYLYTLNYGWILVDP